MWQCWGNITRTRLSPSLPEQTALVLLNDHQSIVHNFHYRYQEEEKKIPPPSIL